MGSPGEKYSRHVLFESLLEILHMREHEALEEEGVRLAVALVLVDLAFIDNHFDNDEYRFLHLRLQKLLHASESKVEDIIEKARELRVKDGVNPEKVLLKVRSKLSRADRKRILSAMQDLIQADSHSFETHLLKRYQRLLKDPSKK
jgi:uncharacterized tellurite resistance protein B-like protein